MSKPRRPRSIARAASLDDFKPRPNPTPGPPRWARREHFIQRPNSSVILYHRGQRAAFKERAMDAYLRTQWMLAGHAKGVRVGGNQRRDAKRAARAAYWTNWAAEREQAA